MVEEAETWKKLIVQAIEKSIKEEHDTFYCSFCNRGFKRKGTCSNHIEKEHGPELFAKARNIRLHHLKSEQEFLLKKFHNWFVGPKFEYDDERQKAHNALKEDLRFASFCSFDGIERLIKAEFECKISTQVLDVVLSLHSTEEEPYTLEILMSRTFQDPNFIKWGELLTALTQWKEKKILDIVDNPYEHNSTGVMHNVVHEWECQANSQFIHRSFGSTFDNLLDIVSRVKYVNEELENM